LREIESSGAAGDIGDDQRGEHAQDGCADAVERLNAGEKPRIVDHGESESAQQQSGEADQKEGASSDALPKPPNPRSRRDDNELGNNNQRRDGERRARARLAHQSLAGQRQD
jgi:hypothetical protein